MTKRAKVATAVLGAVAVISTALAVVASTWLPDRRKDVSVVHLYMSGADIERVLGEEVLDHKQTDESEQVWRVVSGLSVRQRIHKAGSVIAASIEYKLDNPKKTYESDLGGPLPDVRVEFLTSADHSVMFCSGPNVARCHLWTIWAQYGQYLVEIAATDMVHPIEFSSIEAIGVAADVVIDSELSS